MWRTFESQNARWDWRDNPPESFSHEGSEEAKKWPASSELFFETGIVLGAAFGTCALVDLLLVVLGIPDVY